MSMQTKKTLSHFTFIFGTLSQELKWKDGWNWMEMWSNEGKERKRNGTTPNEFARKPFTISIQKIKIINHLTKIHHCALYLFKFSILIYLYRDSFGLVWLFWNLHKQFNIHTICSFSCIVFDYGASGDWFVCLIHYDVKSPIMYIL